MTLTDHLDEGDRCEELPAVMSFPICKLGQEVLVDASENVSIGLLEHRGVKVRRICRERRCRVPDISDLGKEPRQGLIVLLDSLHGIDDCLSPVCAIG